MPLQVPTKETMRALRGYMQSSLDAALSDARAQVVRFDGDPSDAMRMALGGPSEGAVVLLGQMVEETQTRDAAARQTMKRMPVVLFAITRARHGDEAGPDDAALDEIDDLADAIEDAIEAMTAADRDAMGAGNVVVVRRRSLVSPVPSTLARAVEIDVYRRLI